MKLFYFQKYPIVITSTSSWTLLLTLFLVYQSSVHQTAAETTKNLNLNQNETNSRNSRQLISLLKNILQKPNTQNQQHPSQQQYQQYPYQHQYQYPTQYPGGYYPPAEQKIHSANIDPSSNYQYPMLNYPTQQHSSVPLYNDNLQQQQQHQMLESGTTNLNSNIGIQGGNGGASGGSANSLLALLSSGSGGSGSNLKMNSILTKLGQGFGLGIPDDLDVSSLLNFGSFEGMIGKVNQFDKLQCIPRMICQMVSKRNEDQKLRDSTSTTTTTTTERTTTTRKPRKKSRQESGRFIKIEGVDTALDQFVRFLDLMQLKDWSLYPYVKGMYEGHQVKRSGECAEKFHSCPFSEDQLVYYFNNYNGGFFQSFRSGRNFGLNQTQVSPQS